MKLKYTTLRKIKDAENWVDAYTAEEIAKKLKELITNFKNDIPLDNYEQIIFNVIKAEIITGTEKEKDKELIKLREQNKELLQANNFLREKNKLLTAKII